MAGKFRGRGQAGGIGFLGDQDGRALVAALLVQPAADHLQRALLGEVEEAAGQRGDADIDVARYRGRGDRLRGLEEAECEVDALVTEVAAFLGDVERRGRERVEQAKTQRIGGVCGGAEPDCHCEERSDAAIPIEVCTTMEIAASLRSSQ